MARLLFEKTGRSVWISHLDLMRLFQRAFKRAQLPLKHTQGFNPRPSVSIALPLSVGIESVCELLDFELEGELPPMDDIRDRLNENLVEGIRVLEVSHGGKKIRDLALLKCHILLQYDRGAGEHTVEAVKQLFAREQLTVMKKSKNGPVEQDIIPLIRSLEVSSSDQAILIEAVICCQNPTLNPMLIPAAVSRYLPEHSPDHAICKRLEIYDAQQKPFR